MKNFIAKYPARRGENWQQAASFVGNAYRISAENGEYFEVKPQDIFLAYNGTALSPYVKDHPNLLGNIPTEKNAKQVYDLLKSQIDPGFQAKYPHTHNFQYIDAQMIMDEMKKIGFSEVYPLAIGQSVAPALWEECFNIAHSGFNFAVEAIK